jgi:hypothetical protein
MKLMVLALFSIFLCRLSHTAKVKFTGVLGARSLGVERGAVFSPLAGAFAGVGLAYGPHLKINGPQVVWEQFGRRDPYQLKFTVKTLDDGKPMLGFRNFDESRDYRTQRSETFEFVTEFGSKFGFKNLFKYHLKLHQDLKRNRGHSLIAQVDSPMIKFLTLSKSLVYNSTPMAEHLYGPSAVSGAGAFELGLNYTYTKMPFPGIGKFQLSQSWIIKDQNRSAEYIRNQFHHLTASFFLLWFIN